MAQLPWLLGVGAVAVYAWTRRGKRTATASVSAIESASTASKPTPATLPGRWVWPVPSWNGRPPVVSDRFDSPRPNLPRHGGLDIMFERAPGDPQKRGTPNGSKGGRYVMPDDMVAMAASDGVVFDAAKSPTGYYVVIKHAPKLTTMYAHLEQLFVAPKQLVKAGDPIGIIGGSPLDAEHLKHLHFEVWLGDWAGRIDPEPFISRWEVLHDPRLDIEIEPVVAAARNAGFTYRAIGSPGKPYPQWIRDLKGKAGVYVIREAGETVYVGSSRTQLYDTLTRHFQTWRRWKGYWRGQFGEGHDPGLTYARDRVEVAVRVTSPARALDEETRLIRRLRPRDNLIGQPVDLEPVPF